MALCNDYYKMSGPKKSEVKRTLARLVRQEVENGSSDDNADNKACGGRKINVKVLDSFLSKVDYGYAKSMERYKLLSIESGVMTVNVDYLNRYYMDEIDALGVYLQARSIVSFMTLGLVSEEYPVLPERCVTFLRLGPLLPKARTGKFLFLDLMVFVIIAPVFVMWIMCDVVWKRNMILTRVKTSIQGLNVVRLRMYFMTMLSVKRIGRFRFLLLSLLAGIVATLVLWSYVLYYYNFLNDQSSVYSVMSHAYLIFVIKEMIVLAMFCYVLMCRLADIGYKRTSALLFFVPIVGVVVLLRCLFGSSNKVLQ
jgi:uncharacterized membrane protein YhaH (DUF805 family)